MGNLFRMSSNWLACLFLLLSISCFFFDFSLFESRYVLFYGLSIAGLVINLIGRRIKNNEDTASKFVSMLGLYGNLAIVIVFFPPVYFLWGTLIFGP